MALASCATDAIWVLGDPYLMVGLVAIPIVLAVRWLSVFVQVKAFSFVREFSVRTITILTWDGLRGGISVALALSLPVGPMRDAVVVFSILVQGLTINRVLGYGVSRKSEAAHS